MSLNSLLSLSRNIFKAVGIFEKLFEQSSTVITELREIKELLQVENMEGRDQRLLCAEEMERKLRVTRRTLTSWGQTGKVRAYRIGKKNYYRICDLGRENNSSPL